MTITNVLTGSNLTALDNMATTSGETIVSSIYSLILWAVNFLGDNIEVLAFVVVAGFLWGLIQSRARRIM